MDEPGFQAWLVEQSNTLGLAAIIALLWIVFTALAPGFRVAVQPLRDFQVASPSTSSSAYSTMVVLATGGMNLAIGSIGVCSVMLVGYLMQKLGLPVPLAFAGGLALGALLGFANGVAIVRSGVNSFIITLASASLFMGGMLILTKATIYNGVPPDDRGFRAHALGLRIAAAAHRARDWRGAPRPLSLHCARPRDSRRRRERPRRRAFRRAGRAGHDHRSTRFPACLRRRAGLMLMTRLGAAMPSIGQDWLLPSFLAPVLGGTLLAGGFVSIIGTMLGALLVTTIRSGLLILQVGNFWLQLFLGVILLLAVMLDRYRGVYAERRSLGRRS